jgi:hypothetical protein
MSIGGEPWWKLTTGRPFHETLEIMNDEHDIRAVGFGLRAHPTDDFESVDGCGNLLPKDPEENIRLAFRGGRADILVLWMHRWSVTGTACDGSTYIEWQDYPLVGHPHMPEGVFEHLYRNYGDRPLVVVFMSFESDVRLSGKGCLARDNCAMWDLEECVNWCETERGYDNDWPLGTRWFPEGYTLPDDCLSRCCDMNKLNRRDLMLRKFNARQAAAEAARWKHRHARLKVYHAVEIDRYGTQDEWLLVARDVIPHMDSPPDFIGLSLWPAKAGDVIESFRRVQRWTNLASYRYFIAEVGAKELQPGDQYARIMKVVPPLFDEGVAFALVWSMEQSSPNQQTLHALIDPETGEYRSGYQAIQELNAMYR